MIKLLLSLIAALSLPVGPMLSHGYSANCSEECNDYYCPPVHQPDKIEKVKKNIPSKKWNANFSHNFFYKKHWKL